MKNQIEKENQDPSMLFFSLKSMKIYENNLMDFYIDFNVGKCFSPQTMFILPYDIMRSVKLVMVSLFPWPSRN